ncbi:glutathione transferase [Vogesella sp. LIG4]|uniref:glutathione transferase n=1 Tax=Vogesella sp. LIG4 TaxID=1192162 RepID=UPI00081FD18D|nr:glutathione transferase [Vogesella sp. LIG4]SCK19292.1 Glutathione S-transferase [Vogesella sp. LIG4]
MSQPYLLYVDNQYLSPYAMSAFVTLTEKQLPFELRTVDLDGGANRQPAYAALTGMQRVPLLVAGEFRLAESSAICEYLEELLPTPAVYPAQPQQRAQARQLQAWLRSDLLPLREQRTTEVVFRQPAVAPLDAAGQQAAAKLQAVAAGLLAHGGEHLFGDWCIADADLALMLQRLLRSGEPLPPQLADYATRQWQRPSLQAWRRLQAA